MVGCIDIEVFVIDNFKVVVKVKNKDVEDVVVIILNCERYVNIIFEFCEVGVRIKLINDGDVVGVINMVFDYMGVDILFGFGGVFEGVFFVVVLKVLGGEIIGKFFL